MTLNVVVLLWSRVWFIVAAVVLSSCGETSLNLPPPLTGSGQVIALGGGNAGVQNACVSCHGLYGEGDGKTVPYLSGIDQGYLHRQLDDYANGRRLNKPMAEIAARLTPLERGLVSAYYEGLARPSGQTTSVRQNRIYNEGDAERGLAACVSCHGVAAQGIGAANPPLAGQPAGFLQAQLQAWKRGDRQNDPEHVMLLISQLLSDVEIAELSAYLSQLPRARQPQVQAAFPPAHRGGPRSGASALRQYVRE